MNKDILTYLLTYLLKSTMDELTEKLAGSALFSKIDLLWGYLQLELAEDKRSIYDVIRDSCRGLLVQALTVRLGVRTFSVPPGHSDDSGRPGRLREHTGCQFW